MNKHYKKAYLYFALAGGLWGLGAILANKGLEEIEEAEVQGKYDKEFKGIVENY